MSEVTFIRRKGKVIPIRKKQTQQKGYAKLGAAAAVGVAGIGVSTKALNLSASFYSKRAKFEKSKFLSSINLQKSRSQRSIKRFQAKRAYGKKLTSKAVKLNKLSKIGFMATAAASGFLFASGVEDLAKDSRVEPYAGEATSLMTTGFGVATAYAVGRLSNVKVKASSLDDLHNAWTKKGKKWSRLSRQRGKKKSDEFLRKHTGKGLFD